MFVCLFMLRRLCRDTEVNQCPVISVSAELLLHDSHQIEEHATTKVNWYQDVVVSLRRTINMSIEGGSGNECSGRSRLCLLVVDPGSCWCCKVKPNDILPLSNVHSGRHWKKRNHRSIKTKGYQTMETNSSFRPEVVLFVAETIKSVVLPKRSLCAALSLFLKPIKSCGRGWEGG